jgi:hypothetical protein
VDSSYYSESELCGGAVTVSFFFVVPSLANDAVLTTLYRLLGNVMQTVCRKLQEDSGTGGFLASDRSSLFMVGKALKFYGARSGLSRLDG